MRQVFAIPVIAAGLCASCFGGQILYDAAPSGGDRFVIRYTVENVSFARNEELDLQFDPALYATLSAFGAPSGFDVLLLQPNNPPGAAGDLSALALFDLPNFVGQFSVTVVMVGDNRPGAQDFVINQLDENGVVVSRISSGQTGDPSVPEPGTLAPVGTALLGGCIAATMRCARRQQA